MQADRLTGSWKMVAVASLSITNKYSSRKNILTRVLRIMADYHNDCCCCCCCCGPRLRAVDAGEPPCCLYRSTQCVRNIFKRCVFHKKHATQQRRRLPPPPHSLPSSSWRTREVANYIRNYRVMSENRSVRQFAKLGLS